MNNIDKTIAFSNGEWVKSTALAEHLGVKSVSKTPLGKGNLISKKGVSFEVHKNADGEIVRYRAFSIEGKTPIEIAKLRKSFGICGGIE